MSSRRFWALTLGGLAVVTLLAGWLANRYIVDRRVEDIESRLLLVNNLRRAALSRYLETAEAELRYWSTNPDLVGFQRFMAIAWQESRGRGVDPEKRLREVYITNNPFPAGERAKFSDTPQATPYRTVHALLHPLTSKFVSERGYYDFFLIDTEGNIAYTVEKEDDFGTNLLSGPYRETGLADVFRRALAAESRDRVVFSDFQLYAPSNDAPAMFMAKAMHDIDGTLLGVLAFQLPTDRIARIMEVATEGTRTGEAYIVGQDRLMRSESRFSEDSTVLKVRVDTDPVELGLAAEYGVALTDDYRGVPVYSAYSGIAVDDFRWALLVEIDRAEVLEWASGYRGWLAGILLFFYSIGAWSAWFIRGADAGAAPWFGELDSGDGSIDAAD
jgi:methyl-accepting chemotaxis protein